MVEMFDYSKIKYTFVRIFGAVVPRACDYVRISGE